MALLRKTKVIPPLSSAEIKPFPLPRKKRPRVHAIDLARGFAITLMILSHGTKGLLDFDQFPEWGMVPVHLITKFSSTLFILVFGLSLSITQDPYIPTDRWPQKRNHLLVRGLLIFFWYKALTIVEMFHLYSREDILNTLLYKAFPVYVEILGFYALALLWVPLILPTWKKSPWLLRALSPLALGAFAYYLSHHFHFWNVPTLRAVLVEHPDHYSWGQLARGPVVLVGLLLGDLVLKLRNRFSTSALFFLPALVLGGFFLLHTENLSEELHAIALNEGKHPPGLAFMLFSGAGALFVLALAFLGGKQLSFILKPITFIGQKPLEAFIFHILVIFVFYRYLFDYWHKISYDKALTLTFILFGLTVTWLKILDWVTQEKHTGAG